MQDQQRTAHKRSFWQLCWDSIHVQKHIHNLIERMRSDEDDNQFADQMVDKQKQILEKKPLSRPNSNNAKNQSGESQDHLKKHQYDEGVQSKDIQVKVNSSNDTAPREYYFPEWSKQQEQEQPELAEQKQQDDVVEDSDTETNHSGEQQKSSSVTSSMLRREIRPPNSLHYKRIIAVEKCLFVLQRLMSKLKYGRGFHFIKYFGREPPVVVESLRSSEQEGQHKETEKKSSCKNSSEQDINFDLTLKTKNDKIFSNTHEKEDSLLYSNATHFAKDLHFTPEKHIYSHQRNKPVLEHNGDSGNDEIVPGDKTSSKNLQEQEEAQEIEQQIQSRIRNRSEFQSKLHGEDNAEQIQAEPIKPVIRRSIKSIRSSANLQQSSSNNDRRDIKLKPKFVNVPQHATTETNSVFKDQIDEYTNKITKIRELKELKKRKLQNQLLKINREIQLIQMREEEIQHESTHPNTYESRMKIAQDMDAKEKAERLVKNLRSQKRNRLVLKQNQFSSVDKNIEQHMQQLMRDRYRHDERTKQRKQLEIIERMKQQELRKIDEQKKKEETCKFIINLKNSLPHVKESSLQNRQKFAHNELTPQLSRKKAYLNRLRHFSVKKSPKTDVYQHSLY